jgi:hypothetical protein
LLSIVDPEVINGILKARENSQQKMALCEERTVDVKKKYSDIDTETARLKEWEVCIPKFVNIMVVLQAHFRARSGRRNRPYKKKRNAESAHRHGYVRNSSSSFTHCN